MRKNVWFVFAVACAWLLLGYPVWAQKYDTKENAELAKALKSAKVSLEQGLVVSQREGTPISGKFEIEDRKFQLSVYTMKEDKFSEVIVDYKTGKVAKVERITGGEDLTAAKSQSEAMANAKRSLRAAVDEAAKANKGFRAVSITPALKEGHPVAEVTLVRGREFKTVSEKLD